MSLSLFFLGKTLTASVWANAFHKTMAAHIVVICPISVQHEWQRTFEQAIGLTVQDLNQKKSKKQKADKVETAPAVTIYSWAKVPCAESLNLDDDANQKFVVIADECHSIQSVQSARTKATLKLVLDSNCVGVMMLSGTPMKNGKVGVFELLFFALLGNIDSIQGRVSQPQPLHFCLAHGTIAIQSLSTVTSS
jgi:superfamily II DNA or RNA helicase